MLFDCSLGPPFFAVGGRLGDFGIAARTFPGPPGFSFEMIDFGQFASPGRVELDQVGLAPPFENLPNHAAECFQRETRLLLDLSLGSPLHVQSGDLLPRLLIPLRTSRCVIRHRPLLVFLTTVFRSSWKRHPTDGHRSEGQGRRTRSQPSTG